MRKGSAAEMERTTRCILASKVLRDHGFDDVAKFLLAKEKQARAPVRRAKRKVAVRASTGKAARGGAFWMDGVDLREGEIVKDKP